MGELLNWVDSNISSNVESAQIPSISKNPGSKPYLNDSSLTSQQVSKNVEVTIHSDTENQSLLRSYPGPVDNFSKNIGKLTENFSTATAAATNLPFLNGFVSAMSDQSSMVYERIPNVNQVSFGNSFVPAEQVQGTSDRISEMKTATYHQNGESSQIKEQTTLPEQMTMNTKTPQHHAVTNNSSKNIIANKSTGSAIEPIFPPNYFLSAGMLPWEPSPAPFATSLGNETNTARGLQQTESCDKNNAKNKNGISCVVQEGNTDVNASLSLLNTPDNVHLIDNQQQVQDRSQISSKGSVAGAIQEHQQSSLNNVSLQTDMVLDKIQGQNSTGGTPQSVKNCTPGSTDIEIDLPLSNELTNYASSSLNKTSTKRKTENTAKEVGQRNPVKRRKRTKKDKQSSSNIPKGQTAPNFYLFDAPCELRANFMQSQLSRNGTVTPDSNDYHYNLAGNRIMPLSLENNAFGIATLPNGQPVQLVDGRHRKKTISDSARNEREQQRAKKITELIETLRDTMTNDGWKVEMKSKYHTLSTCTEYLKHLIKVTKEKEEAVMKAKLEVTVYQQKIEEDKALQESRSDRESVMSGLTNSSSGSGIIVRERGYSNQTEDNSTSTLSEENEASEGNQSTDIKICNMSSLSSNGDNTCDNKKTDPNMIYDSSTNNSNENSVESKPSGKNIQLDKMNCCASERAENNNKSQLQANEDIIKPKFKTSSPSISAVVSDNILESRKDKRKYEESSSSLDDDFALNYEEAFVTSNVPQLISTTAGRIITCNKSFLFITGLTEQEVKFLTIFSLVQTDKLSRLFGIIADSLSQDKRSKEMCHETITLPCIPFVNRCTSEANQPHSIPLNMTVKVIPDEDPKKKCLHCTLTDISGANDKNVFVSAEMLALCFPVTPLKENRKKTIEF